jgi:hypothetical protein
MEPVVNSRSRIASFDLNIQEQSSAPVVDVAVSRRDSGNVVPLSSLTIGPQGKVVRCEKCNSFFYSQRGQTASCPECRVQLGFSLPADGVSAGLAVYYQEGVVKNWKFGKIKNFIDQSGEFCIIDGPKVPASSIAPPGKDVGAGAPWPKGTNVLYLSATYQTWLPAYIEGFNETSRLYDLDVKAGVSAERIRARVKRLT